MNTKELTGEQISAFADGECADAYVETTLAALRESKGKFDWEIYHQIGDVLRADDMAINMSPGFAARMAARLDAEPTIIAPVAVERKAISATPSTKRWAISGMLAAATAAVVAFVATPQLMVIAKKEPASMAASTSIAASTEDASEDVVLRDSRIDDYLLAHQRFSPSPYSTAQYARSATFAADSNK